MRKAPKPTKPPSPGKAAGAGSGLLSAPETARPWPSLVFLAPFLALYTLGLAVVHPGSAATADLWLRRAVAPLGVSGDYVPVSILVVILLVWHLVRRDPWRFPLRTLAAMLVETGVWVVPLLALYGVFQMIAHYPIVLSLPAAEIDTERVAPIITTVGTAIYEELIFRLILVSVLIVLAQHVVGMQRDGAIVAAVLVAAGIFAGAHTLGNSHAFTWPSFLFRTAAGVYLSALFAYRGFGIAAGAHFAYNVIIQVVVAGGI